MDTARATIAAHPKTRDCSRLACCTRVWTSTQPPVMTGRSRTAQRIAIASIVCLFAIACRTPTIEPSIEFTTVPKADAGGPVALAAVAGLVKGARPGQRIVLFARSDAGWWVQPFRSRPFTAIERDATWKSAIHLGQE